MIIHFPSEIDLEITEGMVVVPLDEAFTEMLDFIIAREHVEGTSYAELIRSLIINGHNDVYAKWLEDKDKKEKSE